MMRWVCLVLCVGLHCCVSSSCGAVVRRVVVVGGGAAGFFSAIQCAAHLPLALKSTVEVLVLEAGKTTLAKVLVSGGGRCNVMHDPNKGLPAIMKAYPRGQRELIGPYMKSFGPWETMQWFEDQGCRLKVEADGRMFPVTDK